MTRLQYRLLLAKARWQTTTIERKYRARQWWELQLWTEAELRAAWGDR